MIRVRDLAKQFAGASTPVLREVSFEVPRGALAVILGASGAGKTTLLRCLAGLDAFDRGAIEIDGLAIAAGRVGRGVHPLRGRVGLVFQSFELFPHLTVLENCTLAPRRVRGLARGPAEARARALLGDLGLGDKCDAFPEQLSGGQRQRVAIARALALEPSVLLYDEPTSALDPSLRDEVIATLGRVRAVGVTQIVVSHDNEVARRVADCVFVLSDGRVFAQGTPESVLGPEG